MQAQYLRGVNVAGAEFGDGVLPGIYGQHYTYNSEQTFDYFAARSLNFIRLQVRWERLQPVLGGPLDPANLGYLAYYVAALLVEGKIKGNVGETFTAGKLGSYTIAANNVVLLGPPTVFNSANIDQFNF